MKGAWVDGLARSVAEPASRREALRRFGFGLAGAAISGLLPRRASAAPLPDVPCGPDRILCTKIDPAGIVVSVACCPPGQRCCDGACTDLATDERHCGACGRACPEGMRCEGGTCVCPPGTAECHPGVCTDVGIDTRNCGACGNHCPSGTFCSEGICVCHPGQTNCNGVCVDTGSDPKNCGMCGRTCPPGTTCTNGACGCPSGTTPCPGGCKDLATDPQNCGACGTQCPPGSVCVSGMCVCPAGQAYCSGVCTDIQSDPDNCGACGNTCSAPNATMACSGGMCVMGACDAGYADCDGNLATGCETEILSDPNNCGGCGLSCPAGWVCQNGQCVAA